MGFHQLTTYLDSLEDIYGIHNLDCLIQREHQVVYRHLAGHSDYEQKIPVKETDLYFFFSATKLMTMTAAVQLIEQGKLHLYDPVWNYLPEYEVMYILDREFPIGVFPAEMPKRGEASHYAATQMRIIDLMSMTAGLTYDTQSEAIREVIRQTGGKAGTREIVRAIAKMPLIFEPGTRWAYSLGHDVMAAVIEEAEAELEKLEKRPNSPDKVERMKRLQFDLSVNRIKLEQMDEELAKKQEEIENLGGCRLVADIAYPGLVLTICDIKARLKQVTSMCNARLSNGEIRFS